MKNIFLSAWYSILILIFFSTAAIAADITINGSVYFKCNFISKYMEKHGYFLIQENVYMKNFKTNLFAAKDAKVIIKNKDNTIVGVGKTDKKGNFSISVPEDSSYQIIVRFNGREIKKIVSYPDIKNFTVDLGYFSTEKVGRWIDAKLGLK